MNTKQWAMALVLAGLVSGAAQAALVGHWAADGNALDSTGNNPGTLVNGVTYGAGYSGQAFQFDGSNYVQTGTTGFPTGNQDRTIFLRFNLTSAGSGESFLAGYGTYGAFNQAYEIFVQNGALAFSQWGWAFWGGVVSTGQWHSAAITNSGNSLTLYLDGVQVGTGSHSLNTSVGSSFVMGRIPGFLGDTRKLNGLMDDVSVYDTALSAAEISALNAAGPSGNVPEPATLALTLAGLGLAGLRRRRPV